MRHTFVLTALLGLPLLLACAPDESSAAPPGQAEAGAESSDPAAASIEIARKVRDLVSALTPPPPTSNSAVQSAYIERRRETLKELKQGSEALGHAVRRELEDNPDHILDVRRGLLEVAAYTVPAEMESVLAELVTEYGEDLGLRTKACELLGETHPERAVAVLEPLIREPRPGVTLPPAEIMVQTYAEAAQDSGYDAIDPLTEIATNLFLDQAARLFAVRAVADYEGARAREAIRVVVIESSGNGYLRRMAAQELVNHAKIDATTKAQLCDILTDIADKETDANFLDFMLKMLDKHCS